MKRVNSNCNTCFQNSNRFPKQNWNIWSTMFSLSPTVETPDRIVLQEGCNDINNKNSTLDKTANEIGDMVILCRGYGVNGIFISPMICRRNASIKEKVKRINFLLKLICEENEYLFIDNSNIETRDLCKDGNHLLESEKTSGKLPQNFIYFLNIFFISLQ